MPAPVALAATVACGAACAALVAAERRGARGPRIGAKLAASAAFLVVGASVSSGSTFAVWILAGLGFGALGDAFLLGRGDRMFLGGLVAFLLGHLAYLGATAQLVEPARWLDVVGWPAAIPIAVALAALLLLWPRLGSMRLPVIAYVAVITAMVVGALAVDAAAALPAPQRTRLLAGAALFFASDLAVARDRFVGRSFANKAWGLPAYFGGQLLIAWSIE